MALHGPTKKRERILVAGPPGSGKSRAWISVAELSRLTKSDARFYVIDTDFSAEVSLDAYPKLEASGLLEIYTPIDFDEMIEAAIHARKNAQRGDWIISDMASIAWEWAQNDYTEKVYGMTAADFFLLKRQEMEEAKKKKSNLQPFDGAVDWQPIKLRYAKYINMAVLNNRAHVIATAGTKPIARSGGWKDSDSVINDFGHIGHKPAGEKNLSHAFNTVMFMGQKSKDEWEMSTGKERWGTREYVFGERLREGPKGQFARRYLVDVAGWELK